MQMSQIIHPEVRDEELGIERCPYFFNFVYAVSEMVIASCVVEDVDTVILCEKLMYWSHRAIFFLIAASCWIMDCSKSHMLILFAQHKKGDFHSWFCWRCYEKEKQYMWLKRPAHMWLSFSSCLWPFHVVTQKKLDLFKGPLCCH